MSTTIPALNAVTDIIDTDLVMVTHANGTSYTISGANLNKRNQAIIASSKTITGAPLKTGNVVRVLFTADITAANSSTTLSINYNGTNYSVKVCKNGALANYTAFQVGNTYKYCQAYTEMEFIYNGTNFIISGNPLVVSNSNNKTYADGTKFVVDVEETYIPSVADANLCIPTNRRECTWRVYGSNTPDGSTYFIKTMMTTESQKRVIQLAFKTQSSTTGTPSTYIRVGVAALNTDEWSFGTWKQLQFVS